LTAKSKIIFIRSMKPLVLLAGLLAASGALAGSDAQRAIHLLEYIAVDYPGALESPLEYEEQLEFAGEVAARLEALEADAALRAELDTLAAAIRSRSAPDAVAQGARTLAARLRDRFGVLAIPRPLPPLERGRTLYAEACAACHGSDGRGDGAAGRGLDPAPSNFRSRERMLELSPASLFATISFGIAGTGMGPFAEALPERDRFALALFVGSLAFEPDEVARGRALVEEDHVRLPGLVALVEEPASALARSPEELAVVAYLRTHPEVLARGELPLAVARRLLEESRSAHRAGDPQGALALAIAAYLDGLEPVEPTLDAVDPELRRELEAGFLRYRSALRGGADVEPLAAELARGLARAERRLGRGELRGVPLFLSSLLILAREGVEAILIVVALCSVLVRAGRSEALRFVHAGWAAALLVGAGTALAARHLVALSGAQREVIEGVSSLLATAILFYVSFWLVSKIETRRWQSWLDARFRTALSRGSAASLALVSFVAVYRESLETALFYQALWAQASDGRTVLLGMGAATGCLAVVAVAMYRFGLRMPIKPFFVASSVLLYALAIVLAGHGVAALQEAGWIPVTWVRGVRIDWLGIHPTAEGLGFQGLLLVAALAPLPWTLSSRK
jgi:high-affinity iron transporter